MSHGDASFVQGWYAPLSPVRFSPWVIRSSSADVPDGLPTLSALSRPHDRRDPSSERTGGLRMTQEFVHRPVMTDEVVAMLSPVPPGVVIDATVGGGGHAEALLRALPDHMVLGLDRDQTAVDAATARLSGYGRRALVVRARFDALARAVDAFAHDQPVVGVLFDLGVSSPQIDTSERGFSYRNDGPLDMRMDQDQHRSAADVVNDLSGDELTVLFTQNGDGRYARLLSHAIVAARPLSTTGELVSVVERALPPVARKRPGHPAARVFQAIRIAVNEELEQLSDALEVALSLIVPRGRCVVISYHSGEDRLTKAKFATAESGGCTCPPGLPCVCGAVGTVRVLTRGARLARPEEVATNPRSSSARLRAAEILETASR